jgi:hypothetical protein
MPNDGTGALPTVSSGGDFSHLSFCILQFGLQET